MSILITGFLLAVCVAIVVFLRRSIARQGQPGIDRLLIVAIVVFAAIPTVFWHWLLLSLAEFPMGHGFVDKLIDVYDTSFEGGFGMMLWVTNAILVGGIAFAFKLIAAQPASQSDSQPDN